MHGRSPSHGCPLPARPPLTAAHDIPWAQLNVYLITVGSTTEYCGQNTLDSPTWRLLTPEWATSVTITVRVYQLSAALHKSHTRRETRAICG